MSSPRVTKRSELWQRIRAVRKFAQLTQLQVSAQLQVSRAAITLWESRDEKIRTNPSAGQMMALARLCKVPASWLMDDAHRADSLEAFMKQHQHASAAAVSSARSAAARKQATNFWQAVQHSVVSGRVDLAPCFGVTIDAAGVPVHAAFVNGACAAAFLGEPRDGSGDALACEVGKLLLLEKAYGKPMTRLLMVHTRSGAVTAIGKDFQRMTGVKVVGFNNISKAAKYLMQA